jgi:hypothetical protein
MPKFIVVVVNTTIILEEQENLVIRNTLYNLRACARGGGDHGSSTYGTDREISASFDRESSATQVD